MSAESLPRPIVPFVEFATLLRGEGFAVAPEQTRSFVAAVGLLGPRSMEDVHRAAVATLAAGLYVLRNPRITEFSNDVVSELRKVTWPSRKETQSATVVVIITTIIIAIILGAMDFVWLRLTAVIYS